MIDLSSALLSVSPPPPAPVLVADGAVALPGSFARTLGAFLDAADAALAPQMPLPLVPARQATADPGKDLPPDTADAAQTPDPSAAAGWFAALPLPAAAIAPPPISDRAVSATPTAPTAPIAPTAPPASGDQLPAAVLPRDPAPTTAPDEQTIPTPPVTADIPATLQAASSPAPDGGPDLLRSIALMTARAMIEVPRPAPEARPAQTALPLDTAAPAIVVSALPQPAGQVFASARAIAGSWREHAQRGDGRDQPDVPTSFASAAPIDLRERAIVQAAADTAHTALDLTADSGLQRMIDRIETLRDAADAGDTRVRLIPDALGSIDVAVRQEGERVHVRFTAEHEATRALIAEAQPRLTELAAARGVRIGDTSVSTGTGGGGTAPQPRPVPSRAPASARPDAAIVSTTDHRLA